MIVDIEAASAKLDKKRKHDIDVVVDRVIVRGDARVRVIDSVEAALRAGGGLMIALGPEGKRVFSERAACHACGVSFGELSPQSFSFNSPLGACEACNGLGTRPEIDEALVVPDGSKSIRDGAIEPWAAAMKRDEGWKASNITWVLEKLHIDPALEKNPGRSSPKAPAVS